MARILIVDGGARALSLARQMLAAGHAVRVTSRDRDRDRDRVHEIEAAGAEPWVGMPERLGTLRGALDGVAVACWLLAGVSGENEHVAALHGSRLEFFLGQAIDSTLRGFVYEASPGALPQEVLAGGTAIARRVASRNVIPCEILEAPLADPDRWLVDAVGAIQRILEGEGLGG